jgi:hypothetical protein
MADPISISSGILALIVFAFKSSGALYQAVASLQSNQRTVRELKQELEDLNKALEVLQEMAINTNNDFTMLRRPLLRCGKACKDFEAVIVKCITHTGESKTSLRDWAKLRYMGDDMSGFKNLLAGYRSTIVIALSFATNM